MPPIDAQWQLKPIPEIPQWFSAIVRGYSSESTGDCAAQLLWQRGIQHPAELRSFLDDSVYQPTSSFSFGQEMQWAVARLAQAYNLGEKVTIWGDFDADGVTATSVLWEGLGEFFTQHLQLNYYIPNRLEESHGLNCLGIQQLSTWGTKLIVTCDTGSTNLSEIEYAHGLGIDVIITDHHSLPPQRPQVVSIINPRYLPQSHPLYHLSGVAVAYKLIEALWEKMPDIPRFPVEDLLDFVAIGLIADLVELKGDCRYLAQKGLKKLQQQIKNPTRPGIAYLLQKCQGNGDRPTDISFGIGPRINAVSRITGDAKFCVELLTSRESKRCRQLAQTTEIANTYRRELQKEIFKQAQHKIGQLDLSTTAVIILEDPQWNCGILGLVAGQIAQEYSRPTILLTTAEANNHETTLARGSARSVNNIDLYDLLLSHGHLLERFGGHPFAAGLSLPVANIPLLREGLNQQLKQKQGGIIKNPIIVADLVISVSQLGKALFRELKLLEPYGMGNPVPRLLISNCWFKNLKQENIRDHKKQKVSYIKTEFELWDETVTGGFPGVWWGHYQHEIPATNRCDVIVELDFNSLKESYHVRLIAVRPAQTATAMATDFNPQEVLIDCRTTNGAISIQEPCRVLTDFPLSWDDIRREYEKAIAQKLKLVLAYSPNASPNLSPQKTWETLVGIAKYLSRSGEQINVENLQKKLGLSDLTFDLGLQALEDAGFSCYVTEGLLKTVDSPPRELALNQQVERLLTALSEEQFQREYFYQIPLSVIAEHLHLIEGCHWENAHKSTP